ncbi:MAG: hypothetical protein IIW34_06115 [Clostridia bacterium]|nr:hypothetical protein [Clostridia bacterium]
MNLKEAFRFQNKLQALMNEAQSILLQDRNITKTQTTVFHKKIMPELENEVTVDIAPSEYADRINEVVSFLMHLLDEHEKLARGIHDAKAALPIDMDNEVSLNGKRQNIASVLRRMVDLRSSEQVLPGGGIGYRFNAEGNQVSYRCDAKRVTTINFDRNKMRSRLSELNRKSDEVSAQLDRCMVNSEVAYEAPFDVNDSFPTVFENYLEAIE